MADDAILPVGDIVAEIGKTLKPEDPFNQSRVFGDEKPEGETLPRRSAVFPGDSLLDAEFLQDKFTGPKYNEVTLYSCFQRAAIAYAESPCLGTNGPDGYEWLNYATVAERAHHVGCGFRHLGIQPENSIGIYSKNNLQWVLADLACHAQSLSAVALYDTFGETAIEYIINHAELPLIVTAPAGLVKLLAVAGKCPTLKTIIVIGDIPEDASSDAVELKTFEELEKLGRENPCDDAPPKPETLAVIMYTSGTTGMPKGVLHRHSNLVCTLISACLAMGGLHPTDVHLSYLPLAHIFERMVELGVICHGGKIGFFSGDIRKIRDDISALKPTIFAGVPKVYDRFKSAIEDKLAQTNFFLKFFVDMGMGARREEIKNGKTPGAWSLIFKDFRESFGGKLRFMVSGGAPLSPEVRDFLRVCFGCPFIQGYGLTETSAAGTTMLISDHYSSNHIGAPVPSVEIKLVDIPEMNYLSTDEPPRGEICIRGPSISSGYYKDAEKTAADFEENGWYHTGDVGEFRENGALAIIDRKKNIFKLAQGEYVAAENIELKLSTSRWVGQFWLYGDSLKDCVVAIITLDPLFVAEWSKNSSSKIDLNKCTEEELNQDEELLKAVEKDIFAVAKENKLPGFEIPKAIYLAKEWTPESDLVTPTMKLKRPQLKKHYAEVIDNLYKIAAERAAARAAASSSSSSGKK